MNYDNLYEICREKKNNTLISCLQNLGLSGNFSGNCLYCHEGRVSLVSDKSYNKDQADWRCSNRKCNKM